MKHVMQHALAAGVADSAVAVADLRVAIPALTLAPLLAHPSRNKVRMVHLCMYTTVL